MPKEKVEKAEKVEQVEKVEKIGKAGCPNCGGKGLVLNEEYFKMPCSCVTLNK